MSDQEDQDMASGRYLDLLNFSSAEEAYKGIKKLASNLSDNEHLIRSCIFDLHAAAELELQRLVYHMLHRMIGFTDDKAENEKKVDGLDRMVSGLSYGQMWRLLRPVLESWPFPEFSSFPELNVTRNQAAHGRSVAAVTYKGRNPFQDVDCFAQMYLDVWAIKTHGIPKLFWRVIEEPEIKLKKYRDKYGEF